MLIQQHQQYLLLSPSEGDGQFSLVGAARGDSGHWQESCLEQQPADKTSASAPSPASQAGSGYGGAQARGGRCGRMGMAKFGVSLISTQELGVFRGWQDCFQRFSSACRTSWQLLISEAEPFSCPLRCCHLKFQIPARAETFQKALFSPWTHKC